MSPKGETQLSSTTTTGSSQYSLKNLKPLLEKEGILTDYIVRFARIIETYGYNTTNSNVIEFCSLIVDDPTKFKDTFKNSKWKAPKTISEMIRSIKTICTSSSVKNILGKKYDHIIKELDIFKKELTKKTKSEMRSDENVSSKDQPQQTTSKNDINSELQQHEIAFIEKAKARKKTISTRPELYKIQKTKNHHIDSGSESESGITSDSEFEHGMQSESSITSTNTSPSSTPRKQIQKSKKQFNISNSKYNKIMPKLLEIQNITNSILYIIHEQD